MKQRKNRGHHILAGAALILLCLRCEPVTTPITTAEVLQSPQEVDIANQTVSKVQSRLIQIDARIPDDAQVKGYVDQALAELIAGKAVSTPKTRPYGCGVKYAN